MTDAYMCDRCRKFAEGYPAVEVDIETVARQFGGDVVLASGESANWSREDPWVEFCPACAVAVIGWVDEYTSDKCDNQE